jgi:acetyltransferase-like isoleucine patch superfamily enzyme
MKNIKEKLHGTLLHDIYMQHKWNTYKRQWRNKNRHNQTSAVSFFHPSLVDVGKESYGELNVISFGEKSRLHIGNYVSIAQQVSFLLDAEHHTDGISTYPFRVKMMKLEKYEAFGKGDIVLDDDVWIGCGATIMSGVHIGQGSVIAAGAVVTKDVPPYAIAGGVPAKVIKYRFSDEMIQELLKVDYSRLTKEMIAEHIDELYQKLTDVKQLEWLPKRMPKK